MKSKHGTKPHLRQALVLATVTAVLIVVTLAACSGASQGQETATAPATLAKRETPTPAPVTTETPATPGTTPAPTSTAKVEIPETGTPTKSLPTDAPAPATPAPPPEKPPGTEAGVAGQAQTRTPATESPAGREIAATLDPGAARAALKAAAEHLGMEPDQAHDFLIEHWERVQWPDSSLGCGQEGMVYAQAIIPGYRITLSHQGRKVNVHTDETGQLAVAAVNCQGPPEAGHRPTPQEEEVRPPVSVKPANPPLIQSAIQQATLREPSGEDGQYHLHVISGRSSGSCTARGDYEVERADNHLILVTVFHHFTAGPRARCTMDWVTDEHMVPLGSGFNSGEEYTVVLNQDNTLTFRAK